MRVRIWMLAALLACDGPRQPDRDPLDSPDGAASDFGSDAALDASADAAPDATPVVPDGALAHPDAALPELRTLVPSRGSADGGEWVTLYGAGFTSDAVVTLGSAQMTEVRVLDPARILGRTGAHPPGVVTVTVAQASGTVRLAGGYRYEDPVAESGGVGGGALDGTLTVTVRDAIGPSRGATVQVIGDALALSTLTDEDGQAVFRDGRLQGAVDVTAYARGDALSILRNRAREMTLRFHHPAWRETRTTGRIRGVVTGLDDVPKPVEPDHVQVIVVGTSRAGLIARDGHPDPGPGSVLEREGAFEITARQGTVAVVATVGDVPARHLDAYRSGSLSRRFLLDSMRPVAMGLQRDVSVVAGSIVEGVGISLDLDLDQSVPMRLNSPPHRDGGPDLFFGRAAIDLGDNGYWPLPHEGFGLEPAFTVESAPAVDALGGAPLTGLGYVRTAVEGGRPYSVARGVAGDAPGVIETELFVATPRVEPPGGRLAENRHIRWAPDPGWAEDPAVPHAQLIIVGSDRGGRVPLWTLLAPGDLRELTLPPTPDSVPFDPLRADFHLIEVIPVRFAAPLDPESYTFDAVLDPARWTAYSLGQAIAHPTP